MASPKRMINKKASKYIKASLAYFEGNEVIYITSRAKRVKDQSLKLPIGIDGYNRLNYSAVQVSVSAS